MYNFTKHYKNTQIFKLQNHNKYICKIYHTKSLTCFFFKPVTLMIKLLTNVKEMYIEVKRPILVFIAHALALRVKIQTGVYMYLHVPFMKMFRYHF